MKYIGDLEDNRKPKDKLKDFSSAEIDLGNLRYVTLAEAKKNAKEYVERNQFSTSSCFTADMKVLMADNSYKPIKEVRFGEEVIDADGNKNKVVHTMHRLWQGNLYKIKPYGVQEIQCTPEHPFLTKDGWKIAKDLTDKDFLVIPINKEVKDKTDFWWEKDKDFLIVYGLFLAEGHTYIRNRDDCTNDKQQSNYKITFTFHQEETDLLDSVISLFKRIWNLAPYIGYKKDSLAVNVSFSGKELANYFRDIAGDGCKNKRIHSKFMLLEPKLQKHIFDGWVLGDGHLDKNSRMTAVSISEKLITQMQNICFRNGLMASVEQRKEREDRQTAYNLRVSFDNSENSQRIKRSFGLFETKKIYRRIHKIDIQRPENKYNWGVYNLTIENSNTFTVNNIAVHNCVPSSIANALFVTELIELAQEPNYRLRKNYPNEGCYWIDQLDLVLNFGMARRNSVIELKSEKAINLFKITDAIIEEAKIHKQKNYIFNTDFDDIIRTINNGYPVVFSVGTNSKEWSNDFPQLLNSSVRDINHAICAIPNTGYQNKNERGFFITDSAHFGKVVKRNISESFYNYRKRFNGAYFIDLEFTEPFKWITPPQYKDYKFHRDLTVGSRGQDVKALQTILKANGFFPDNIGTTFYFGGITRQAVKDFQKKYEESILWIIGLKLPTGYFGRSSRKEIERLINN